MKKVFLTLMVSFAIWGSKANEVTEDTTSVVISDSLIAELSNYYKRVDSINATFTFVESGSVTLGTIWQLLIYQKDLSI